MLDNLNNQEEVVEEQEGQEETQPEAQGDQSEGIEGQEPQAGDKQDKTEQIPDFLDAEHQAGIKQDLERHPELKVFWEDTYKKMQGDYTKKMQAIAQDRKELDELRNFKKTYGATAQRTTETVAKPTQEQKADFIEEFLKTASPEEKAFVNRFGKVFDAMIDRKMGPLCAQITPLAEQQSQSYLASKYKEVDVAQSWSAVQAYKKLHPSLSDEEALLLGIARELPNYYRKLGKEEALASRKGKPTFIVGGSKTETPSEYSDEELAKMPPEEYAKAMGLPRRQY